MRLLAKSDPPESLKEHTDAVLKRVYQIRESELLNLPERDWKTLEMAAFYHDLGKADPHFQRTITEGGRVKVPHNYLSLALLPRGEWDTLAYLVAFHHWRKIPNRKDLKDGYLKLKENIDVLRCEMGRDLQPLDMNSYLRLMREVRNLKNRIETQYPLNLRDERERRMVILLGLLMRADHSASAHVCAECPPIDKTEGTYTYLRGKTGKPAGELWQTHVLKRITDESAVVVASTGMGKTELALLWAGRSKLLYTLPMRTSTNAMFQRLSEIFGRERVGLLHSNALAHILGSTKETDDAYYHYSTARQLAHNLIVSTADQVFASVLRYPGHEKVFATLSYSKIVVDELQAYSPNTMAIIVKGLEMIRSLGGKFLIITATFPSFLKNYLVKYQTICKIPKLVKHNIEVIREDLLRSGSKGIADLITSGKKVLVVLNSVKRAQEFYRLLRDNGLEPLLIHSRFTRRDRREKERRILRGEAPLLVSTQVVEVSLDIDYDVLLTDIAPADALIQRMGRVQRRFKTDGDFAPERPNVLIFAPDSYMDVIAKGKIYDRDITKLTLKHLKDGALSERDKVSLVEEIYSERALRFSRYLNKFKRAYELVGYVSMSRSEAQRIFREVSTVEVLPEDALNWRIGEGWIQQRLGIAPDLSLKDALSLARPKDRMEKVLWIELVQEFAVPIPAYWYKGETRILGNLLPVPTYLARFPVVHLHYDPDLGATGLEEGDVFL